VPWLIEQLQPQRTVELEETDEYVGSLEDIERRAILSALRRNNGNQSRAAKILGISDRTLREKIKRYRSEMYSTAAL
jgi:DNA-binding NtrC family response regulator